MKSTRYGGMSRAPYELLASNMLHSYPAMLVSQHKSSTGSGEPQRSAVK